jgi:hypothetical protein
MRIQNGGNVGIGTASPYNTFTVYNTTADSTKAPDGDSRSGQLLIHSGKSGSTIYAMAIGMDQTYGIGYLNAAGNNVVQPICLQTRGGNVGIGTTSPSNNLSIFSNITLPTITQAAIWPCQLSVVGSSTGQAMLKIGTYYTSGVATYGAIQSTETYSGTEHVSPLALQPIGGKVGIGTTNPSTTLHVSGASTTYTQGQLFISDANNTDQQLRLFSYYGGSLYTSYCTIQSIQLGAAATYLCLNPNGGAVCIGTTAPPSGSETFTIASGTANTYNMIRMYTTSSVATGTLYFMSFNNNNANVGYITTNAATGVTTYGTGSDVRLKKNINYNFDGLSIIDQLKPACFTMISDSSDTVYHGFIAQDIAPIYPQYVTTPAEGIETGYYSMDYSQFMSNKNQNLMKKIQF